MGLVLTENGVEQIDKPKLSELGKQEVLGKSLKRLKQENLQLVVNGKTEKPKLCANCFKQIAAQSKSDFCSICINAKAIKAQSDQRAKDWRIFFWVLLFVGICVAALSSWK